MVVSPNLRFVGGIFIKYTVNFSKNMRHYVQNYIILGFLGKIIYLHIDNKLKLYQYIDS